MSARAVPVAESVSVCVCGGGGGGGVVRPTSLLFASRELAETERLHRGLGGGGGGVNSLFHRCSRLI